MDLSWLVVLALGAAAPAADPSVVRFKFGPAGIKPPEHFQLITEKDAYAPGKPGWLKVANLQAAERAKGGPLARSFVYGHTARDGGAAIFKVDLAPGSYAVVFHAQDLQYPRGDTPFDVEANGVRKLKELRAVSPVVESFVVDVGAAGLELRIAPSAVKRPYNFWLVNSIVIGPAARQSELETELAHQIFAVVPQSAFTEVAPPATPNPASPSESDRQRGYQVWCHDPMELVFPSTQPPADAPASLSVVAWPGMTTCAAFSVRALADLGGPEVRIEGSRSPAAEIRVERVWVRPIRIGSRGKKFIRRPDALLPLAKIRLARWHEVPYELGAEQSQTYWLTINVPGEMPAGAQDYLVRFAPKGRPATTIPLRLEVLSLRPPAAEQYTGVYWRLEGMPYPGLVEKDLAGMVAHGVRAAAISPRAEVRFADGKCTVDASELLDRLALLAKAGLRGDMPYSCGWMARGLAGKENSDPAYERMYQQVVAEVQRQISARGLPNVLWYPVDEPGNHPERLAAARRWLGVIRQVPGARTYCTPNSIKAVLELAGLMDARCIQQLSLNEETVADTRRAGETLYFYTSAYNGDRLPDRLRFLNGVFLFKSGARAIFYWHYQHPVGDPLNDLDGETCDYQLCHPSQQGPIATLGWEAIREGNNDVALLAYLRSLGRQAAGSSRPGTKVAGAKAEAWLNRVLESFPLDGRKVHENISPPLPPTSYDRWRREAAELAGAIVRGG